MASIKKPYNLSLRLECPKTPCPDLFPVYEAGHSQETDQGLPQLKKLRVIGRGNGGTFYKASHKETLAIYALKIMHGDHGTTQELDILRQTNSPYVVQCHQIFEKPYGEVSILMEYLDAGTLETFAKSFGGRLSEDLIAIISCQVPKGFVYLRSKNIVHRDIKPSNLLINRKMEVKIADFGVSKIMGRCLDRCGSYVGTCAYMSPERFNTVTHGDYDGFAADVWSFGVTMMELYKGCYPFLKPGQKPEGWPTLMLAICFGEPSCLEDCSSEKLRDFIRCCLQRDPSDRWTASQLLLHPFLADA